MSQSEMEELCVQLDKKLLLFMDQLELLGEKRAALNSLIEQGWFSISKARYSMGNKQVSALQYASDIEPLVSVHTRTLDDGLVEFRAKRMLEKPKSDSGRDDMPVEDVGPQEEGVRRRFKTQKNSKEQKESEKESTEDPQVLPAKKREQNPHQDPLKWFGILVPQALRQAQTSFREVIELSAEIATLQTAILDTRKGLQLGMKRKLLLKEKQTQEAAEDSSGPS